MLTVNTAAATQGNKGPQWELSCTDPFFVGDGYPVKFWIDRTEGGAIFQPGAYPVVLVRGALKDGKDGSLPWMYRWRITDIPTKRPMDKDPMRAVEGVTPQPTQQSVAAPAQQQGIDPRGRSIERQVALKAAVDSLSDHAIDLSDIPGTVLDLAHHFFAWLSEAPAGVPSSPPQQSNAGVPTTTPVGLPVTPTSQPEPRDPEDQTDLPW